MNLAIKWGKKTFTHICLSLYLLLNTVSIHRYLQERTFTHICAYFPRILFFYSLRPNKPPCNCNCLLLSSPYGAAFEPAHSWGLPAKMQFCMILLLGNKPFNKSLVISHTAKSWSTVSGSSEHRTHPSSSCLLFFCRLSTVNTFRFETNQMKILTFSVMLIFYCWTELLCLTPPSCRKLYNNSTENFSDLAYLHLTSSFLLYEEISERVTPFNSTNDSSLSSCEFGTKPVNPSCHFHPLSPKQSLTL